MTCCLVCRRTTRCGKHPEEFSLHKSFAIFFFVSDSFKLLKKKKKSALKWQKSESDVINTVHIGVCSIWCWLWQIVAHSGRTFPFICVFLIISNLSVCFHNILSSPSLYFNLRSVRPTAPTPLFIHPSCSRSTQLCSRQTIWCALLMTDLTRG